MARIIQYIHRPNLTELGMGNTHDRYLVGPEDKLKQFFPPGAKTEVVDVYSNKVYTIYSKFENNEFRIKLLGEICDDYQMEPGDEIVFTRYESTNGVRTSLQIIECGRVFLNPGKRGNGIIQDFEIVNIEKLPRFSKETNYLCEYSFLGETHKIEIVFSETRRKRTDSPMLTDFYSIKYDGKLLESKNNPIYYLTIRNNAVILKSLPKYEFNVLLSEGNTENDNRFDSTLQQIFYGAPGTGKSHATKVITEKAEKEGRVVRTTFHPDSDYSTFVGAYKPTMSTSSRNHRLNLSMEDLAQKLGIMYNDEKLGKIGGLQKFCYDYFPYISGEFMSVNVTKLLELAGVPSSYNVEVNKYINFCGLLPKPADDKIVYTFVPQAFTNAYVKAWNTTENVYLIIEEINRGNCAQIFGDLFQLLDRNEKGESDYHVDADTDLGNYIASELESSERDDFPKGVKEGKKLVLPSNLYIWATMNTSDQSLFPIDSAFKRRWDWKYIPIEDAGKGWKIVVNEHEYDWYKFLEAINHEVLTLTHSEDKQLGYFFVTAKNGVIDAEMLVNKVYFYLWTDVFKDYDYESQKAFKKPDSNDPIAFKDFFVGHEVNEEMAERVLINLELNEKDEPEG